MKSMDARLKRIEQAVSKKEARDYGPNYYEELRKYVESIPEVWKRELLGYYEYLTSQAENIAQCRVWPRELPYKMALEEAKRRTGGSYWDKYGFILERVGGVLDEDQPPLESIDRKMVQDLFLRVIKEAQEIDSQTKDDFLKILSPHLTVLEENHRRDWKLPSLITPGGPYWRFDLEKKEWIYCGEYPTWNGTTWVNAKGGILLRSPNRLGLTQR